VPQVFERGQFALRGGILDVFSLQSPNPFRIELFDDEVESLRKFEIDSQMSIGRIPEAKIVFGEPSSAFQKLADYQNDEDIVISVEEEGDEPFEGADVRILETSLAEAPGDYLETAVLESPVATFEAGDFILQEQKRESFLGTVSDWLSENWSIAIFFNNEGEIERFRELLTVNSGIDTGKVRFLIGSLQFGFVIPTARIAVLTDAEIFGRYRQTRAHRQLHLEKQAKARRVQNDFRELNDGDLVVHLDYGIARYQGLFENRDGDMTEEVLVLEYADDAKLYVPLDQAHLVSRYVGSGKKAPPLNKLGGGRWGKTKATAEKSVMDYAAQLLRLQAERQSFNGYAHPEDTKWQVEFENSFLYKETPDQLTSIDDVKRDMESPRPTDRLICGDVGFGKTEVAIRAAFKAVMSGKQVAFLCPTTVLAQQHYQNFRERMSDYPIEIDLLSRFRTAAEQRKVVKRVASGEVDVIIGTHRLISKDIAFKNLGLVVIDEEQRFGVLHKERFKELFRLVDVITLSATPIPRTLYLSLMGVRDMSTIETPPPNRTPVETVVCGYDERIMRDAINRELKRGGQVFFVHNRVMTIESVRQKIEKLVPKAKIDVGHGQMEEGELEEIMQRFIAGETDVLVCTTIIESGIDIPNANTIIIDRADRFGLADLYQLRGRVGRADNKAYAILMIPRDMMTIGDAKKRISAIKQYTALGSGFKIAMRDLEIRGAGNLLGTKQSGHIAAVGFDLYCQLLKQSVERLTGDGGGGRIDVALSIDFLCTNEATYYQSPDGLLPAFVPARYMPDARMRISGYKELAELSRQKELKALLTSWRDRFGPLPDPADNLFRCMELKVAAAASKISVVEIKEGKLMLTRNGEFVLLGGKFPRLHGPTPKDQLLHAVEMVKKF
ncbi:MAG: transcription-repair coupling factor, partial [Verrucomicrobiota bacterium]